VFAWDPQGLSAGSEDSQSRRAAMQRSCDLRSGLEQLLTVIEDEQDLPMP
jgi:hypothetical protein